VDVYRDVFQAYTMCTDKLDLLNLAGPSWIPERTLRRPYLGETGYYATSNSTAIVSYSGTTDMVVIGLLQDHIDTIRSPLTGAGPEDIELARQVWLKNAAPIGPYVTGVTMVEACAWTMAAGRLQSRESHVVRLLDLPEAGIVFHDTAPTSDTGR
jgi:hypothetical protein